MHFYMKSVNQSTFYDSASRFGPAYTGRRWHYNHKGWRTLGRALGHPWRESQAADTAAVS
jgi:hypothetical protein